MDRADSTPPNPGPTIERQRAQRRTVREVGPGITADAAHEAKFDAKGGERYYSNSLTDRENRRIKARQ